MGSLKRRLLPFVAAGALTLGIALPVSAHPFGGPVVTGGLVNVTIVDAIDINNVTVQLPIAAAANVCNVSVLSLVEQGANPVCTADADSRANR